LREYSVTGWRKIDHPDKLFYEIRNLREKYALILILSKTTKTCKFNQNIIKFKHFPSILAEIRKKELNKLLIPAQRRERIQEHLLLNKIATNAALSELLRVSEATIRRDLEVLEGEGFLERTHGGAVLRAGGIAEAEYLLRAQRYPDEKRLIGAAAANLIDNGDVVFINSGTTTTQLIRAIRPTLKAWIITNNVRAALELAPFEFELALVGGVFQPTSHSVAGRFAADNLRQIYATKAFISVEGIHVKYGLTVPTEMEAELIRIMFERTIGPVTVVADHSKWGAVSSFEVARLEQVQRFITDEGLNSQARAALADRNIDVQLVPCKRS
jgi:DeoR family transcriptional regulator, fructose operon transcriptional repressor